MFDGAVKYTRLAGIPTIVASFIVPQVPIAACLKDVGTDRDLAALTQMLNLQLAELVASEPNCYFLNIDATASALGKAYILDEWFHLFTHNATFADGYAEGQDPPFFLASVLPVVKDFRPSIEDAFHKAVWRQIESLYRSIRQIDQVKLVIFDLDNTISRGLIAEHYSNPDARPSFFGWPEGVAEAIHHLRARGILVALCSKNDEAIVAKFWSDALSHGLLKMDDFVVRKIGWRPKPETIAEIMTELSLTATSVVFVDDNHLEREAVKAAFPEIRIIGENQFLTKTKLLWAAECQVPVLTQESIRREQMTRGQLEREVYRARMSRSEFLRSLECRVEIFSVGTSDARFPRCIELINKTNQFNTTGQRWTSAEISGFLAHGGLLIAFTVADRFVDYGLVGVLLYEKGTIVQYVMSCRIIGIGVEEAVLNRVMDRFAADAATFRAMAIDTDLNTVSRDIFDRCGFVRERDGYIRRNAQKPNMAPHLCVKVADDIGVARDIVRGFQRLLLRARRNSA
ncbi:MAG TPA: HAD-IIIC family phosphatase [Xanthobacteraceae bacterium]